MKIKNVNLQWYVLEWDVNNKKIKPINILAGITEDLVREIKSGRVHNKSILREYLKTVFVYYYWSKAEHEMIVSDLFGKYQEKIDVWKQIEPNLDLIVDYVNIKCDLKLK